MFWEDVLLGCEVPDAVLGEALATALGVATESVRVVDAVTEAPNGDDAAVRLLVERALLKGDFPLHLSLYVTDAELVRHLQQPSVGMKRLAQLAGLVGCACLVSDGSVNPASWLRILPSGTIERVMLDPERLDRDEYMVTSASPMSALRGHAV